MNEQEIASLRQYLSSQSMRRTPAQLVEALQATTHEFLQALANIPEPAFSTCPTEAEWSAAEITAHVLTFFTNTEQAICMALEQGKQPPAQTEAVSGAIHPPFRDATRKSLLASISDSQDRLSHCVLQAEPDSHLDLTWDHFELGPMHWRQWFLFLRVHLAVHVRQMQTLGKELTREH